MAKRTYVDVGGQAVIEGVMMRAPGRRMALAVRDGEGIVVERTPDHTNKSKGRKIPILRGVLAFVDSLTTGMKLIDRSLNLSGMAEEEEPSKFDLWLADKLGKKVDDILMITALLIAVPLAVLLFIFLPSLISSLLRPLLGHWLLVNLAEGIVRLAIFVGYMWGVSLVKDVRRTYCYHGAEHKTINCFEAYGKVSVELARPLTTRHPRCGTSFLFLVMFISIIIFSFFGEINNVFLKALTRLVMIPVVAGISYEVLKLLAHSDNRLTRILRAPGIWLQGLSTKEPDDSMLEVAIAAFEAAYYDELPAERNWMLKEERDARKAEAQAAADEAAPTQP